MPGIADDRRMSDVEGLMWRIERDPALASTFAVVSILDRPPDFDRLRRRLEHTAEVVPRLRQVVRPTPGSLAAPAWVDDPEFSVDGHLRRVALPPPGSERQLLDLASTVATDPFDRTRPLWQFVVVEGLEAGRAALIEKLHHTISDGEGAVQLAFEFLDLERDAPDPPARANPSAATTSGDDPMAVTIRDALDGALRLPLGVAGRVRELLADPGSIAQASNAADATATQLAHQLATTDRARSPLWTRRSGRRRVEVTSASLARTRGVAKRLGGTLNTAFLTIAAEAAGGYHAELGEPVDELRTTMPISTRRDGSGANAFTLARMLVPTGDLPLEERFHLVEAAARAARDEFAATHFDTLAALSSTLPAALVTRLARQQARTVDFATSNVNGSPVPVYVAGAQLLRNHPIGPVGGVAFNLTLLSYGDRLDMGINIDTAAVERPELLKRQIDDAVARFGAL